MSMNEQKYKVIRTFSGRSRRRTTLFRGRSLEEAERLTSRPCASSATDKSIFGKRLLNRFGEWIDTYEPDNPPSSEIRQLLRERGFDV